MKKITIFHVFILLAFSFLSISLQAQNQSCLDFDGNNDYVKYNDDATLGRMDGATDYTIEAWIYPKSSTVAEYDRVLQRYYSFTIVMYDGNDDGNVEDWYFQIIDDSGNHYYNTEGDATLTLDAWNHIAVINNSSDGTLKLFVDGVDVTTTGGYSNKNLRPSENNDNLYIGQKGNGASCFGGKIDEVRLKNIAEDPGDLQDDVSDPEYTSDSNTAGLFHFDEKSGSTTVNEASSSNATLNNGVTWITDVSDLPMNSGLPLNVLSFQVKSINNKIELDWECKNSIFIQSFEIQKSQDLNIWRTIGFVDGERVKNNYSFVDKNPFKINYYRLKEIAFDGIESFSKIISISLENNNIYTLYPNPAEDIIYISGLKSNETISYKIYDIFGKKIDQGLTNGEIRLEKTIPGLYFLHTKKNKLKFMVK